MASRESLSPSVEVFVTEEEVLSRDDNVEEMAEEPSYPMLDNLRLVEPEKEIEVVAEPGGKEQEATAQDGAAAVE